ncbi:hypothetical protein OYT1_ch1612 [Ferriphaselus amnicola]|uniref:Uncharacterized protein n=1 Tax=Ferriphaselus amnicola TaxID=1188319 RepID=A0A2Z6GCV7_9PROT|nr:hypothetical protein [Ferriphaselus amnicola]BBE51159.1 hypothetical protein OYT1_ch1612 [Ferriphaselus amnicola]
MSDRYFQSADALSIFTNGNQADEEIRLLFCNRLISLADLESYPRKKQFIEAFSTDGAEDARRAEALALADACIVPASYIVYCAEMANAAFNPWADHGHQPEII